MPWVEAISDGQEMRRTIRDLVALSTLPATWQTYEPHQIADSVTTALVSMLDCDFAHISLPPLMDEPATAITHTGPRAAPGLGGALPVALADWLSRPSRDTAAIAHPLGSGMLYIAAAPIGYHGEAVIVAGSHQTNFPTEAQRLLLGIAANDAAIALQRWHAETGQRLFAQLVENSSEFIAIATLQGVPQYINTAGLQLIGLDSVDEARRWHVLEFLSPQFRAQAREVVWPCVMRDGRWVGELALRNFKTGGAIPFLVDWFRVDDPRTGRPTNMATVSRDLTAQKRADSALHHLNETLEQRVAERTAQLAEANRKLIAEMAGREHADARLQALRLELHHASRLSTAGQMGATLAHELNQPLTAAANSIAAARRLLQRNGTKVPPSLIEFLDDASGQTLRAGQIIRQLRDFVRLRETEKRDEDASTLIEEAVALALAGAGAVGVRVNLRFDPAVSQVLADRLQIQQVLTNLMRNALEAMVGHEHRELTVTTTLLNENRVEISVADSGDGLSGEARQRLFEPFFSTKHDGMGLGLSICRSIVEAHGGKLQSLDNPDGGTIFLFTLAAAPKAEGAQNAR